MTDHTFLIETPSALDDLVARLAQSSCVAIDTEFVWERTFYARLGLIQAGTPDGKCYLIDTVAISDLSPLGLILADSRIEKVLHDAPQDLMLLRRATGVVPRTIFDTRLASGFAGLSSEISLQNLLATLIQVQLPKAHTRTNWMARPLSDEQLEYAADDVLYLPRAAALLREKARTAGNETWLNEELALLDAPSVTEESDPRDTYRKIRAAGRLRPRNLAVLRELACWREQEARTVDLPRQHVAEDSELISVAVILPLQGSDFEKCRDLRRRTEERHGSTLLAAVHRGLSLPEAEWPGSLAAPDERLIGKERITMLAEGIRKAAEARSLDPRMVHTKGDILKLLSEGPGASPWNNRLLRGWRAALLKDLLPVPSPTG